MVKVLEVVCQRVESQKGFSEGVSVVGPLVIRGFVVELLLANCVVSTLQQKDVLVNEIECQKAGV